MVDKTLATRWRKRGGILTNKIVNGLLNKGESRKTHEE